MPDITPIPDNVPASTSSGPAPGPEKSIEAHFADAPLFMTELPTAEGGDNDAISALQALVFDETPDEVARNFKEQGNEYFAGRRFREAQGFYTQAIDAKPEDPSLLEVLLVNRAACNLALENLRQVLLDTAQALTLNPSNLKAHYRQSLALLGLERFDKCVVAAEKALALPGHAEDRSVLKVRDAAAERGEKRRKKEAETKERERRKVEGGKALDRALRFRGLISKKSSSPPDNPHPLHFDPDTQPITSLPSIPLYPLDLSSTWTPAPPQTPLIIPTFLLYPSLSPPTSDLLSHLLTTDPLLASLTPVFSPPPHPSLSLGEIVVYVETDSGRLLKIPLRGKKPYTMEDVFLAGRKDADLAGKGADGIRVQDGCVSLVVLPKGDAEKKWVEDVKRRRDEGK